jgi:hypothetical protein
MGKRGRYGYGSSVSAAVELSAVDMVFNVRRSQHLT